METTKNPMTEYEKQFFNKLAQYLDTKLYFYGSIQRSDYFPGSSDIDVDIFTDNMNSTISKMQHFFHVERSKFKKFVYKLHTSNKVVHGYKFKYKKPESRLQIEFSIYDENYKENVLLEHTSKSVLPFYISYLLIVLKFFYYQLNIIPKEYYKYLKSVVMDDMIGTKEQYIVIGIPKDDTDE
jgi:hypothetical protein